MTPAVQLPPPPFARTRATGLAGALAASLIAVAALGAPPARAQEEAPPPVFINPAAPVVVLSYYDSKDLPRLVRAVRVAGVPSTTPLYFGTYAGAGAPSGLLKKPTQIERGPGGGRRAPIFPVNPSAFYRGRQLPESQARRVGRSYSGRIRSFSALLRGPASRRIAWGTELGRRFRDRLRVLRRFGVRASSWQYDEIQPSAAGPRGRAIRELNRGVLQGLTYGRRKLGDRPERGIVFISRDALPLARAPLTPELAAFWSTVDRAAFRLVGEEYVPFTGDPGPVVALFADGQRALAQGGGPRAALASRYVVGMTPGYRIRRGLGGNTQSRPPAEVNAFRNEYVRQRALIGVAGFGQFNFIGENRAQTVINDAVQAIVEGLRAVASRPPAPST